MDPRQYIYHSFPRRFSPKGSQATYSKAEEISKAEKILQMILDYGLLLTPEPITWLEQKPYDKQQRNFSYVQHRICFTELPRPALERHSEEFGEYAIEFTIQNARILGAIPIFYIPTSTDPEGFSAIGATMLHRMCEITELLVHLDGVSKLRGFGPDDVLRVNDEPLDCRVSDAKAFVDSLFHERVSPTGLLSFLSAFLSHFYPTENLQYNEPLGYYKQREWRICGRLEIDDMPVVKEAPKALKEALMALDPVFFGGMIQYEGRCDTRADMSLVYKELGSKHVLEYANAIICPQSRVHTVQTLLKSEGIVLNVVAAETLTAERKMS